MDEGDEHGMGLMGLEDGCGDDGKWVWEGLWCRERKVVKKWVCLHGV